jgi:diguanylate cyclase (GGDEF)-like protein
MKSALKRQNERLTALYDIALDLLNHHHVDDVLNTIILRASELLESPIGFLDLLDGDMLVIQATTEAVKAERGERTPLKVARLTERAIQTRKPQLVKDYVHRADRLKIHDPYRLRAVCSFPIVLNGKAIGAISLGRTQPHKPFTSEDIETMRSLAHVAALAFQSANLFEETQRRSVTDALTGLANRRRFDSFLKQEWAHAMRTQEPLALILADIDSYKKYNDTYGHAAGDECLRRIARVMQKLGRRTSDLAARYGGEELALILPVTNLSDAKRLAEELRNHVDALRIPHQTSEVKPWVTISAGVAAMVPNPSSDPLSLINLADQALYKAKRAGKNGVRASRSMARRGKTAS